MRLVARGLTYRYPSGFTVGPVTMDLGPGLHHLVGANGSGKTTLLRCLCGQYRQAMGGLEVGGRDPRTDPEARRDIALLAAEPELPEMLTVDEVWAELAAIRGRAAWDGLSVRRRLDLPGDLPLGHCSAGQRRLAELLAACAGDPAVLLLDEPFANLDPDHVQRVRDLVADLCSERVVLLTAHGALPDLAVTSTVRLRVTGP